MLPWRDRAGFLHIPANGSAEGGPSASTEASTSQQLAIVKSCAAKGFKFCYLFTRLIANYPKEIFSHMEFITYLESICYQAFLMH